MGSILYKIREIEDQLREDLDNLEFESPKSEKTEEKIKALKNELATFTSGPLNNNQLKYPYEDR